MNIYNRRPWTSNEEGLLRLNYPTRSVDDLASLFPGRTGLAIKARAKLLGLKKWKETIETTSGMTTQVDFDQAVPDPTMRRIRVDKSKVTSSIVLNYDILKELLDIDYQRLPEQDNGGHMLRWRFKAINFQNIDNL